MEKIMRKKFVRILQKGFCIFVSFSLVLSYAYLPMENLGVSPSSKLAQLQPEIPRALAATKNPDVTDTTTVPGYTILKWTTVGTGDFTIPSDISGNVVEYLVVAGGGGGGGATTNSGGRGGGGAGGFRTATNFAVTPGATVTVTVGAGGAGGANLGTKGSDSIFSTITSTGGGGGADYWTRINGEAGGSGGGPAQTGTAGSGNTPSTSPSQGNNSGGGGTSTGGGGGGSLSAGVTGSGSNGGDGGAGTPSSISGASVYYAGGGGGAGYNGGTNGNGGSGVGGAGSQGGVTGGSGATNKGGGGGGGGGPSATAGGAGGSGVVIIKYLTKTLTISGSLYSDEGVTKVSAVKTIKMAVATSTVGVYSTTTSDGDFIFQNIKSTNIWAGVPISVWVAPADCTGGTITYSGGNTIHSFTNVGSTNLVCAEAKTVSYLVVGGGGGGAGSLTTTSSGGGGGAGGFRTGTNFAVSAGNTTVTVGDHGHAGVAGANNGTAGGDSVFSTITATGGGYGGGTTSAGGAGGSGGGGRYDSTGRAGGAGNTPSTDPSQGSNGGPGVTGASGFAGGGGGASEAGNTDSSCFGGDGTASSISGASVIYAGGGGGGNALTTPACAGGDGGGGNGGYQALAAVAGTVNRGGGGGGARYSNNAGADGGTGIVIVSYPTGAGSFNAYALTKASSTANNITGLNLYQNRIIVNHEGTSATSTTIADMSSYDGDNASGDIRFTANGGALVVEKGQQLYIWPGKTFAPGGAVTLHGNAGASPDGDLYIGTGSTLTANGNISLAGNWYASTTSIFNNGGGTNTVTFTATTSRTIIANNTAFNRLTISGYATTSVNDFSVAGIFTVDAGKMLTIGSGTNASSTSAGTMTLNGTIEGAGTLIVANSTLGTGGTLSSRVRFDATAGNINMSNRTYGGVVEPYNGGTTNRQVVMTAGTHTFSSALQPMAEGVGNLTLDGATNNPTVVASGNIDFWGTGGGSEIIWTGTGKWTASGATIDLTDGTLVSSSTNNFILNGATTFTGSTGSGFASTTISGNITMASVAGNELSIASTTLISGTVYPQTYPVRLTGASQGLLGGGSVGALRVDGSYTLTDADFSVGSTTIASGGTLTVGANRYFTSTSSLSVGGTLAGIGTTTIKHSGLTNTGTLTNNIRFNATDANITMPATTYGGIVEYYSNSSASARTITMAGGTHTFSNYLWGNAANTQNITLLSSAGTILNSTFTYGTTNCTGGTITYSGGNTIHSFTNVGSTNLVCSEAKTVSYLVVGGGGNGTYGTTIQGGGGGGGGGFRTGTNFAVSAGNTTVTVGGAGGASVFSTISAAGGGAGSGTAAAGGAGGSGGGGAGSSAECSSGGAGNTPSTDPVQGYNGGNGGYVGGRLVGGGGGGAGAVGNTGGSGHGGTGQSSNITGSTLWYAGGGGGAILFSTSEPGGSGVGGRGANSTPGDAGAGTANRGGGGGGGGVNMGSAAGGGSGIVIVSYPTVTVVDNVDFIGSGAGTEIIDGSATVADWNIDGNFDTSGGICTPTAGVLNLGGNLNSGTFNHNNGTLLLDGTSQQTLTGNMTGANAFYKLTITNTSGSGNATSTPSVIFSNSASTTDAFTVLTPGSTGVTARFLAGTLGAYTFQNINWNGQGAGTPFKLRSSVSGTPLKLTVPGTRTDVSYVDFMDTDASYSSNASVDASNGTNVDSGNNTNVSFTMLYPGLSVSDNLVYEYGATGMVAPTITITENAVGNTISVTNGIRLAIATSTFNMLWDTASVPVFTGTASSKVSGSISFEGGNSVLYIPVISPFSAGQTLTISGLKLTGFSAVKTSQTGFIKIFKDGPTDQTSATSEIVGSNTITVKGKINQGAASAYAVNQFNISGSSLNDSVLYTFQLAPTGEATTFSKIIISLLDIRGFGPGDITDAYLYVDYNGDGIVDAGDLQIAGPVSASFSGMGGSIVFEPAGYSTSTLRNYLLRADVSNIGPADEIGFKLAPSGVSSAGVTSSSNLNTYGFVPVAHHVKILGLGVHGTLIGSDFNATISTTTGGVTAPPGEVIGDEPGFKAPTATGDTLNQWATPNKAFVSDHVYATETTLDEQQDYYTFNFNVPAGNSIVGLEVKLEASAESAGGTIGVELSGNNGSSYTSTGYATGVLTTADVVYRLGNPSNTWAKSGGWTLDEVNNNFRLRVTAQGSLNTIKLDAIQVKVYFQLTGGGQGGGGDLLYAPEGKYLLAGLADVFTRLYRTLSSFIR